MADEGTSENIHTMQNGAIGVFEEAVARAEKLGRMAREAAEVSTKTSQDAVPPAHRG